MKIHTLGDSGPPRKDLGEARLRCMAITACEWRESRHLGTYPFRNPIVDYYLPETHRTWNIDDLGFTSGYFIYHIPPVLFYIQLIPWNIVFSGRNRTASPNYFARFESAVINMGQICIRCSNRAGKICRDLQIRCRNNAVNAKCHLIPRLSPWGSPIRNPT